MSLSPTSQIFLYVVCLCAGMLIGALVNNHLKSARKEEAPEEEQAAPPPDPEAVEPAPPPVSEDLRLFTAWKAKSGRLWLDIDGSRIEAASALQGDQRRRVLNTVLELRPWLASEAEAAPRAEPQTALPAVPAGTKKPAPVPVKPALAAKTILEQIDEVLQAKLEASPYKGRKVQLVEGPGGTVIVRDGLNSYEGIDAIPDPQIQALIRQAVLEWERGSK